MTYDAATELTRSWLVRLDAALSAGDVAAATSLFGEECYWRDFVALTWNIRTVEGRDGISSMLVATLAHARPHGFALTAPVTRNGDTIEAWFRFETATGRGKGHLRLRNGEGYTILTTLQELKGKMAEAASEDVAAELLTSAPARVKEFHLSVKNYQKLLQMNIF